MFQDIHIHITNDADVQGRIYGGDKRDWTPSWEGGKAVSYTHLDVYKRQVLYMGDIIIIY